MSPKPIIRAALTFAKLPDNTLITFARNVLTQLYASSMFTDPPVTASVLESAIADFTTAKAAQANGGKTATAEKNNRRVILLGHLRTLAPYVQRTSNNDLALLLSSGFDAVSNNRARVTLSKPQIKRIKPGMVGQSLVTLTTESTSRGSEVRVAPISEDGTPGPFGPAVYSTSSINILIEGLIPGVLYAYQGRNLGGATTYSDWSDILVQRAY
jgi:hypothetical protein